MTTRNRLEAAAIAALVLVSLVWFIDRALTEFVRILDR